MNSVPKGTIDRTAVSHRIQKVHYWANCASRSDEFTPCQWWPVVMFHVPTHVGLEIVFDEDMAGLGGQQICGFSAQVGYVCDGGLPPDDTKRLAQIGRDATVALSGRHVNGFSTTRATMNQEPRA